MSVVASHRNISKVKYFNLALKIHDALYNLVLQDFGFKSKTKDFYAYVRKADMSAEDTELFKEICNKYDIDLECDFPLWMIDHYRERLLTTLDNFLDALTRAYSVFPNSVFEFNLRRGYQWECIEDLEVCLQTLNSIIRMIPIKADRKQKYLTYASMIDDELYLLRQWKKSCNKLYTNCYLHDLQRNNKAIREISNYTDNKSTRLIKSNDVVNAASSSIDSATSYQNGVIFEKSNPIEQLGSLYIVKKPFIKVDKSSGILIRDPFHKVIDTPYIAL